MCANRKINALDLSKIAVQAITNKKEEIECFRVKEEDLNSLEKAIIDYVAELTEDFVYAGLRINAEVDSEELSGYKDVKLILKSSKVDLETKEKYKAYLLCTTDDEIVAGVLMK